MAPATPLWCAPDRYDVRWQSRSAPTQMSRTRVQGTAFAGSRLIDVRRRRRSLPARWGCHLVSLGSTCSWSRNRPSGRRSAPLRTAGHCAALLLLPNQKPGSPDSAAASEQRASNSISILGMADSPRWSALHYIATLGPFVEWQWAAIMGSPIRRSWESGSAADETRVKPVGLRSPCDSLKP